MKISKQKSTTSTVYLESVEGLKIPKTVKYNGRTYYIRQCNECGVTYYVSSKKRDNICPYCRKFTRKSYTKQDIITAVKSSVCMAEVLVKLGLQPAGGNYANMKRKIAQLELDTSHFTGKLWAEGKSLKDYAEYKDNVGLKNKLIKERGHRCEVCGLTEWKGQPITLELHHRDGNHLNNDPENLELNCPNCHSYTETWRGKRI